MASIVRRRYAVHNFRSRGWSVVYGLVDRPTSSQVQNSDDEELIREKKELRNEARDMTLKLYRAMLRSVRVIRYGNENDEKEFQDREKKEKEKRKPEDIRLSMISMLPPVNRADELRSRAEYYHQYARESLFQESDCLSNDIWEEEHVERYVHHLQNGEEKRAWLLQDMKFPDPYGHTFDLERVQAFKTKAVEYVRRTKKENDWGENCVMVDDGSDGDDDDILFWTSDDDDDDDNDDEHPATFPRRH